MQQKRQIPYLYPRQKCFVFQVGIFQEHINPTIHDFSHHDFFPLSMFGSRISFNHLISYYLFDLAIIKRHCILYVSISLNMFLILLSIHQYQLSKTFTNILQTTVSSYKQPWQSGKISIHAIPPE